jgi:hypothetical protein
MGNSIRKIMKDTISSKKGSFSIEEIRIEIIKSLKKNNFSNKIQNEKITNEYLDNLLIAKKLFRYSESDSKYFYIH